MHAHRIGQQLRTVLLRDHRDGRPFNPRRLQAVVGDLCADAHPDLVAPLRYLVLSSAFASAAGMDPPLADGRLLQRLQSELAQMYAAPLCARLQPLLEGLLDLPASTPEVASHPFPTAAPPPAPQGVAAPAWQGEVIASPAAGRRGEGGSAVLPAVLAFVSGVLLMALAGVGLLLWQRHSALPPGATPPGSSGGSTAQTSPPTPAATNSAASSQPAATQPPAAPTLPPAAATPDSNTAPLDRAVGSIQALYAALSLKEFDQARGLFSEAAADQFDPGFFRQFERVSVQDLQATGQVGSTLNLQGVVTFVWPDGSLQSETRSFSVDTSSDPARITASEFGRVIRPR